MLAALVLVALVLIAGLGEPFGRPGVLALAALSVLWLIVNDPMEGPVLVSVSAVHGLTGADLSGFVGLGLAAYREVGLRRRERRAPTG
jgi:hypothetical protein